MNVTLVLKEPQKKAYAKLMGNELEDLQEYVEGYIQPINIPRTNLTIFCNEEGKYKNLKPNIALGNDVIVGNILIVKMDGDIIPGLTLEEQRIAKEIADKAALTEDLEWLFK
ncbi:DUF3846 domain-containing protein [Paraclostridium bifermentans]|uniref:DUF3846 domain-containing protein n=1 Tax=Paraclostridium bifermentans TaxID=1490 RepID=UPI00374F29BB